MKTFIDRWMFRFGWRDGYAVLPAKIKLRLTEDIKRPSIPLIDDEYAVWLRDNKIVWRFFNERDGAQYTHYILFWRKQDAALFLTLFKGWYKVTLQQK